MPRVRLVAYAASARGQEPTPPDPPPTPDWYDGATVNNWFQISGTNLSAAPPATTGFEGTPDAKITAWNGGCLKRTGSVYYIAAAGGHADYSGNEVNKLDLLADEPEWTEQKAGSAASTHLNDCSVYLDHRRSSTHTYYGTHYINQDDRIAITPAFGPLSTGLTARTTANQAFVDAFPQNRTFCSFDVIANEWDRTELENTGEGFYADWPGTGDFTACLSVMDPSTGNIYYARNGDTGGAFWKWTRATNTWSQLAAIFHPNYAGAAIDFTRGNMLVVGAFSNNVPPRVYRISDGVDITPTFTGLGDDPLTVSGYPGVIYDEANDRFLVVVNTNPITIYTVHPTTWAVAELTMTGSVPAARQNGIQNAMQYVPELKGLVFPLTYTGDVYFMRLQ